MEPGGVACEPAPSKPSILRGVHEVPRTHTALVGLAVVTSIAFVAVGSSAPATDDDVAKRRAEIRQMAEKTLADLYAVQPKARQAVADAAGYAVFSNFGMKIFVAGGGTGRGLAVSRKDSREVFMKMMEVQAGLGLGVKKFRLVWVFENQKELDRFIDSGWELGGQATAAAQASGKGGAFAGAMSISPGVWLYQLTDEGLALELTAKGTKYYKDTKLN
jgi:lipid-binding SYLF domain-containing protein